jgi:hypothetical protein
LNGGSGSGCTAALGVLNPFATGAMDLEVCFVVGLGYSRRISAMVPGIIGSKKLPIGSKKLPGYSALPHFQEIHC